jgi:hypothetical protein
MDRCGPEAGFEGAMHDLTFVARIVIGRCLWPRFDDRPVAFVQPTELGV